jgi:hypothetical protein
MCVRTCALPRAARRRGAHCRVEECAEGTLHALRHRSGGATQGVKLPEPSDDVDDGDHRILGESARVLWKEEEEKVFKQVGLNTRYEKEKKTILQLQFWYKIHLRDPRVACALLRDRFGTRGESLLRKLLLLAVFARHHHSAEA